MLPFLFPNPADTVVRVYVTGTATAVSFAVGFANSRRYPPQAEYVFTVNQHQAEYIQLGQTDQPGL